MELTPAYTANRGDASTGSLLPDVQGPRTGRACLSDAGSAGLPHELLLDREEEPGPPGGMARGRAAGGAKGHGQSPNRAGGCDLCVWGQDRHSLTGRTRRAENQGGKGGHVGRNFSTACY